MHLLRIDTRSLDETVGAVDLGQTPADVVFLSFSDSDLNALARAYDAAPEPKPTLRLASLAALRHPYSIDLYLERVCAHAKLIVGRVLGGADYWRYGVDQLAALARKEEIKLALLPGDRRADARLDQASTLAPAAAAEIWRYFDEGGPENMAACLARLAAELGAAKPAPNPAPVSAFGRFEAACVAAPPGAPRALIVFYRSIYLAGDLEPIEALASELAGQGFATTAVYVTSLKDEAAIAPLRALIAAETFHVVLNATAFSARLDDSEGTVLDSIDAPVLQVVLAGLAEDAWRASPRGLGPADLAMHVALPEIDGQNSCPRRFFQGRGGARRRDRIRRRLPPAARGPDRLRRGTRIGLGEAQAEAGRREAARLRAAGLSRARRPHGLCRRPRHAGERGRHRRHSALGRLRRDGG